LFSCASCALSVSATELSDGYSRKATETGIVSDEFIEEMADFSLSLFRGTITKDSDNDLVSPLSTLIVLAMIANGADGETRVQMESALGMNIDTLNECLYAYVSGLYISDSCKVNLADSIWFRDSNERLHVNEEFLQTNADWYNAQIYAAPFDSTTVNDINNWVNHYSDGMIDSILNEIPDNSIMYLINALVFDAKWEDKYEKNDVNDGTFTNYDKTETTAKMLFSEESVYLYGDGVKGFAKNYSGGAYSFVALLPDENTDIYDYAASLTGKAWLSLWNSRETATVQVCIPEFTYTAQMKLNDVLAAMGMTDMFDHDQSDFSRLGYSQFGNIYCSAVEQKIFIIVDRNGTKAAALTWGIMGGNDAPEENIIYLNRPFVYAIVDNSTGLPLFFGVVTYLK
jgi:serpin B